MFYHELKDARYEPDYAKPMVTCRLRRILDGMHVYRDHKSADEFSASWNWHVGRSEGVRGIRSDATPLTGFGRG